MQADHKTKHFVGLILLAGSLLFSCNILATNVIIETPLGDIEIELFDDTQPLTVANFLNYVNDGDYQDSFIHRSIPDFIIQGGGSAFKNGIVDTIPTDPPVANEPGRSNVRGTIAMAKLLDDSDSATSGWFINLVDNSANLDEQNGGFTVFGQVVGDGMQVVDAIAGLQVWNAGGVFSDLPLIDFPGGGANIGTEHLVFTNPSLASNFAINAGVNDAWVTDGAPLQGLFVTAFPGLNLVFVAWFTFDSVASASGQKSNEESSGQFAKTINNAAVFGADDQRWVTALGSIDGNKAVLNAELTTGGAFNSSVPFPTQDTSYGTITLKFTDCSNASVDFEFPAASESGSFDIHRVLESNVALCESLQPVENP